jgi:hypothetical protein
VEQAARPPGGVLWIAACLSLVASWGCTPACGEDGESFCDDNVVVTCGRSNRGSETPAARSDCGESVCVEANDKAFCAVSDKPDDRCKSGSDDPFCEEGTSFSCGEEGYLTRGETCSEEYACIEAADPATTFCAEKEASDDCPADVRGAWCAGTDALRCYDGYVVARTPCEAPEVCVVPDDEGANEAKCESP